MAQQRHSQGLSIGRLVTSVLLGRCLACSLRLIAATSAPVSLDFPPTVTEPAPFTPSPAFTVTPSATVTPTVTATPTSTSTRPPAPSPTRTPTRTPAPSLTPTPEIYIIGTILTFMPSGDLILEDIFVSTGREIILRVRNEPPGWFGGTFYYRVHIDGATCILRADTVPTGSQAFWSGCHVSGQRTVLAKIDTTYQFQEANEGNNEMTKTCSSTSNTCW